MKIEINKNKVVNILLSFTLILFSIDFLRNGIWIAIIMSIIIITFKNRIIFNLDFLLLILFFWFYVIFSMNSDLNRFPVMKSAVTLPLVFLLGTLTNIKSEDDINKYIYLISIFSSLHGLINLIYNYVLFGINIFSVSRLFDFWSRSISAATAQATKFTLLAAISFHGLFLNRNKIIKYLIFILLLTSIIYNFGLGGRSYYIILILSFISSIFFYFVFSKSLTKRIATFIKIILISIFIIITISYIYSNNVLNIKDLIENSYLYHRFFSGLGQKITEDGRLYLKSIYLSNLDKNLWGGNYFLSSNIGYAHDLWLDVYDDSGILPTLVLIIYTIRTWYRIFKISTNSFVSLDFKILITSFFFILNMQFLVEPILQGSPALFIAYCFVDGLLISYNRNLYQKGENNV